MLRIKYLYLLVFITAHVGLVFGQGSSNAGNYKKRLDDLIIKATEAGNNPDSLRYSIAEFKKINDRFHDKTAAVYLEYMGAKYASLNSDFNQAMQLAVSSLNDAQKWKMTRLLPEIYSTIGNLHKENTNYPMAFIAAQKGLDIARQNHDTLEIIRLLGMKAMFKRGYSLHFGEPIDKDSSLTLRMEALKMAEANPKYESQLTPFYDNIAQHYYLVKDYEKAKYYGKKGIAIGLKYNQKRSLTYSYSFIGIAYYYSGDRNEGVMYLNKALQLSIAIKQPYRKMEIYDDLSRCYQSSSDYKDAFYYLSKYRWLQDSLQVRVNVKQLGELQIKYETAKKDQALALLNQAALQKNKQMHWLLADVILFFVLVAILAYMYVLIRKKNDALTASNVQINEQSTKLQILMKELHHRVKNNLQIVSSLLNLQSNRIKDTEALKVLNASRQRIEAMSIIHNSLYQRDNANKVDMKKFLPVLLDNILDSFGQNREDIDISMEILIDDMDVDIAMPLGLIINEWITNTYKHAYKNMSERPYLRIFIGYEDGQVKLKINDNGIGIPMALWENPKGSFGVKLVKILVKQIGGVSRVSNTGGTSMELDIPYVK